MFHEPIKQPVSLKMKIEKREFPPPVYLLFKIGEFEDRCYKCLQ